MLSRNHLMLFAGILTLAFSAGTARADYKTGNPTKCGLTSRQDCARNAAIWTLRGVMAKRLGRPPYNWTAAVSCAQTAAPSLLKWRCNWGTSSALVTFRALSTGWHRYVVLENP